MNEDKFGCEKCKALPDKGTSVKDLPIVRIKNFYNTNHSEFHICECVNCNYKYLEQFHEIVDWHGGNDDMWNRWTPITDEEYEQLLKLYSKREDNKNYWNDLHKYMLMRQRLVFAPNGEYYWSSSEIDACDMLGPG